MFVIIHAYLELSEGGGNGWVVSAVHPVNFNLLKCLTTVHRWECGGIDNARESYLKRLP